MFLNGIGFDNGRKIVNYKNVGKTPSITIPKPQEEEDFSATQNPEPRAAASGDTIAMPPPAVPSRGGVPPAKHRRRFLHHAATEPCVGRG